MEGDRSVLILYSTETGTAQDAAERLARQCRRIHFTCRVLSTDKYALSDLISETLVLFLISTTGSGVEPRSMTPMWKTLLRADLPSDLFDDLSFAVFGLGDTGYEKFCWPAKKLARRLQSLGATELCDRGEGDEQDPLGIDGALGPWMDRVVETLLLACPLPESFEIIPADIIPAARVSLIKQGQDAASGSPLSLHFHHATVKCNTRITAEDWYQDVRHLEFAFDEEIQYSPGDVAVIQPLAPASDVDAFLGTMGWADLADTAYRIEQTMADQSLPEHLPSIATLREIFSQYLDFNAVPRRSFFQFLRCFTPDELEREKLDEFLSQEGADDLYEYCYQVKRTIREILAEFRNVKIPIEYIFDVFPPMRPRQFSIASSGKRSPSQIDLCVAIVKYRTKLKVPRRGVCTRFLASLQAGDKVYVGVQKGLITLPANTSTPIICIGPGTGVAPMRAVIQERLHTGARANTLYFGCRSAQKDHHYASEWTASVAKGDLIYRAAFSRDNPEGVKRTYVQDLIQEDAERIWALLRQDARVFISGSSNKMPAAIKGALRFAAETHGGLTEEAAGTFVSAMEAEGRLIEECWS